MKSASSGTVILKGESAENKSTQQSWPTFMLQRFQCQQSLFSYAINCLNRLPVEFLMCYKFHVCFPQVDSTQAHCVRPCPVISTGLGRTSTKENPSVFSSLQLYALLASSRFHRSGIWPLHFAPYIGGIAPEGFLLCIEEVSVKAGDGHREVRSVAKPIIQQCSEELDRTEGTSLVFVSSKCRISHSEGFTCRSQTLLPIHFNA